VLDFGIAKAQRDQAASLTHTSAILGSPSYMSPEQLKSPRNADVRSDIWSIGVILYELTSGHLPFTGETLTGLALRISMDPVPPLGGRLPPGFDAVVYRCLEKDPAQRYPDLAELAHALASYAGLAGRDLAGGVSRLLHRTDRAERTERTDRTERTERTELSAGASTQRAGSAAVVEHERGQVATTLAEVTADPAPRGSPPTTMGSAASSMSTPALVARRRGVIAGVAGASILAVVVAIAVAGIGTTTPTSTGGRREPGSAAGGGAGTGSSATPSAPDAAVVVATQPPIDAAAPLAVDAGAAQISIDAASGAGGEPSAADHPPSRGSKKNPPKRDRHVTSGEDQDYGATRH
jgi:serine/threonine-protein kinase